MHVQNKYKIRLCIWYWQSVYAMLFDDLSSGPLSYQPHEQQVK